MPTTNKDTKVITGKVRLSYCSIFKPVENDDGTKKYSCALLIPKSDKETIKKIRAAIEAAKQAGADKLKDKNGKMPNTVSVPFHDGDGEKPKGGDYDEECHGHYVLNTSSTQKPGVIDKNKNEILDSTEVYSGCYGRADINFYVYNTKGNKGVACGLNNIQKVADGDYLGGRSRAEDVFDEYEGDEDPLG